MEEVSRLGCVGLGKKLQRQKKGPWSLGGRKAERMRLGNGQRGKAQACSRERAHAGSSVLRVCIYSLKAGVLGEIPDEDLNGILISFPCVSFLSHGLY